jgi:hypothetical protein
MEKVQIKTQNFNEKGDITSTYFSDLMNIPLAEAVQTVQHNAREAYWEIFDTPQGAVKMDRNGNVQHLTVRLVRD